MAHFFYYQWFFTPPKPTASFAGKTVIVTGANIGLGFEAAKHFARLGASKLILAVRSVEKGEAARTEIIAETKCDASIVEVWQLDLSSFASVKEFAKRATDKLPRLDVLLENAGIATRQFTQAENNESTVTVNVTSTFLLAALLAPKLKQTARQHNTLPHLVIVSSEVHFFTTMKPERKAAAQKHNGSIFAALADPAESQMSDRYNVSKLLEVLAVRQIVADNKMDSPDYPFVMNYMNPGFCHSSLMREIGAVQYVLKFIAGARTTEVGSRTLVYAATAGDKSRGSYVSNCQVEEPAPWVTSEEGRKAQGQVWRELKENLEAIEPGVTKNF